MAQQVAAQYCIIHCLLVGLASVRRIFCEISFWPYRSMENPSIPLTKKVMYRRAGYTHVSDGERSTHAGLRHSTAGPSCSVDESLFRAIKRLCVFAGGIRSHVTALHTRNFAVKQRGEE